MKRKIIGLTGAFGSGASFLAENFFVKEMRYEKFSLSKELRELFKEEKGRENVSRRELQEFGNEIRKNKENTLVERIDIYLNNDEYKSKDIVIDSFRNPSEIRFFREKYPEFILIGVFADYDKRWERVKTSYGFKKDEFDEDDKKDKGTNEPEYGQKISNCFFEADLILSNNDYINCEQKNDKFREMDSKIRAYMKDLDDPIHSNPTLMEISMAEAYASGRRSRCLKRKVGSIITDEYDRIISSGFNGVPHGLQECKSLEGACYRDKQRKNIAQKILNDLKIQDAEKSTEVVRSNIKLLELCRALHAEESAILNLVGNGVSLQGAKMYVTTFPCNLCANKIVQANIKKVVYFEPYPVEEAKTIFQQAHVVVEPFEGVTFRAFFKFFQYEA